MKLKFTYHDSTLDAVKQTPRGDLVFEVGLCPGYDTRSGPATLMLHDVRNSRFGRRVVEFLNDRLATGRWYEFHGLREGRRGGFVVMVDEWHFFLDAKSFTEM
ncbi:MAG: hypothetical protein KDB61_13055 [Planctomycetes bacterium]|nr:hypothetical protein [Planctomycetota bacterium]